MAFVCIDGGGNVVGVFACRQAAPQPVGYSEIADGDSRIATFLASEAAPS